MDHDHSYKLLFSHPRMVRDLLTGFVHEAWVAELDFDSLERVAASYITDDLREREDDIVWRVRWGREWLYVYLLLEFQSTIDRYMAARIHTYVGLLYQDLIRAGQLTGNGRLPPVLPVVLYNGKKRWTAAEDIAELIEPVPGGLERYRPALRYLLLDEGRYSEEALALLNNVVAALFRMENSRGPEELQRVVEALIEWLAAPEQASLRRAFTVWIRRVFLPGRLPGAEVQNLNNLQEVQSMLTERVEGWAKDWKQQGLQEGREQGRKEGREEGRKEGRKEGECTLLERQLRRKFGALDDATLERLKNADADTLLIWGERVLTAETLHEIFE